MKLRRIVCASAIMLIIFGTVHYSGANTSQTDVNNLQRAVIEMKKRIDANHAKITVLEKRIDLLETRLQEKDKE